MMMKILLTGFNPFGNLQTNPTQHIIEAITTHTCSSPSVLLTGEVLPTEYERAGQKIQMLLTANLPDIYLGLGVATQRQKISLERVALNLNDSIQPDNAGVIHCNKTIAETGPPAYFSDLPLQYLSEQLQADGFSVEVSNHAGTYVCNHVFYTAQHYIARAQLPTYCSFVHVPLPTDAITLTQIIHAIECYLNRLQTLGH